VQLVAHYLRESGLFDAIQAFDRSPNPGRSDPLFAVVGRRNDSDASA
jgi:hypothetical protein